LTVAEAEELCALAERLDRRLMVGHLLQYHPAFVKLRELVREGALGAWIHLLDPLNSERYGARRTSCGLSRP